MQGQHGIIQSSVVRIAVCVHDIQLAPEIVPKLASAAGLQPAQNIIDSSCQAISPSLYQTCKGSNI